MRESAVEKAIVDYAKKQGFLCYKFVSPGRRGVPDRMFVTHTGKVIFLEIKAPGKEITPLQMREIEKLRERSVVATWVDSVDDGKAFLDRHNVFL